MTIDPSRLPAPPAESDPLPHAQPSLETLSLLARRRSTPIAMFGAPGPSRAQIEAMLRLAARVPDHGKLGPWRFVVIEGAARARAGAAMAALVEKRGERVDDVRLEMERTRFERAPVVIMVVSSAAAHPKIPEWEQIMSAGAASYQLVLAAHAMGFAATWLTEWPAYDAEAHAALGVKPEEKIAGFVYIGAATAEPRERVRPDLSQRVTWF